ncbi:MAG: glycosyltransferase family 2 protein [Hyphomicrobiales bacterium]|nr:glycosyltransferase family 2 protein [Hyphomicrobiales bacterium]
MIAIVLVNWRRYDDTIECLETLTRMDGPDFRVIVVDNESRPDGVASIAAWAAGQAGAVCEGPAWPQLAQTRRREPDFCDIEEGASAPAAFVTLIRVTENKGYAAANNIGIALALLDPACNHVWLLNNDTIVDGQALTSLLARMTTEPSMGICGSTLLYYDAPTTVQSLGGVYDVLSGRGGSLGMGLSLDALPKTSSVEGRMSFVVGASMLVSRRYIQQVGLMHEGYFHYFEELDWSRKNAGRFRLGWARDSYVFHKEGRSIRTRSRGRSSDLSLYFHNLNFLRFTRRHHRFALPVACVVVLIKCAIAWVRGDSKAARAIGEG